MSPIGTSSSPMSGPSKVDSANRVASIPVSFPARRTSSTYSPTSTEPAGSVKSGIPKQWELVMINSFPLLSSITTPEPVQSCRSLNTMSTSTQCPAMLTVASRDSAAVSEPSGRTGVASPPVLPPPPSVGRMINAATTMAIAISPNPARLESVIFPRRT